MCALDLPRVLKCGDYLDNKRKGDCGSVVEGDDFVGGYELEMYECLVIFFFFQAEDGIRDYKVTGVQTCALPISRSIAVPRSSEASAPSAFARAASVSARSPPTPFASRPRAALESTIPRARSR